MKAQLSHCSHKETMGFQELQLAGFSTSMISLNLFFFYFDEIEHQMTLEDLQNIKALFQVGLNQVNF